MCFSLNLVVQLGVVAWGIFRVNNPVPIIWQTPLDLRRVEPHSVAVLLDRHPFVGPVNLLLFLLVPDFPLLCFALFDRHL